MPENVLLYGLPPLELGWLRFWLEIFSFFDPFPPLEPFPDLDDSSADGVRVGEVMASVGMGEVMPVGMYVASVGMGEVMPVGMYVASVGMGEVMPVGMYVATDDGADDCADDGADDGADDCADDGADDGTDDGADAGSAATQTLSLHSNRVPAHASLSLLHPVSFMKHLQSTVHGAASCSTLVRGPDKHWYMSRIWSRSGSLGLMR